MPKFHRYFFLFIPLLCFTCGNYLNNAAEPSLPSVKNLSGIPIIRQTWNNCGPASLAMAFSFWGINTTQKDVAVKVNPAPEDYGTSIGELIFGCTAYGLKSVSRMGASIADLVRLINSGFPVIVANWHIENPKKQFGHYRLLTGYNLEKEILYFQDPLLGAGYQMSFGEFDAMWRVFGRLFIVPVPEKKEAAVISLLDNLGTGLDCVKAAAEEALKKPDNAEIIHYWKARAEEILGTKEQARISYQKAFKYRSRELIEFLAFENPEGYF